ncbi:MAG: hypothetical protein HOC23_20310 [Halieaceae bacterium]|jgi:hypothetical protein|nr:hypothetical protein [Halieaceae bacterium]
MTHAHSINKVDKRIVVIAGHLKDAVPFFNGHGSAMLDVEVGISVDDQPAQKFFGVEDNKSYVLGYN